MPMGKYKTSKIRLKNAFTLIELLVVITITGILAMLGFINYKSFSSTQILNGAVSQAQSFLRTAQTNATAAVKCNNSSSTLWQIVFNANSMDLKCMASSLVLVSNLILPANVTIGSITGGTCTPTAATVSYDTLSGKVSFTDSLNCLTSATSLTVPLTFSQGGTTLTKNITISKGGGIDAQK